MTFDPDQWQASHRQRYFGNFILAHLAVIAWCIWDFNWVGMSLGLAGYLLFGKVGADIGFHRYFAHHSFQTSRFWEWVFLISGNLCGLGSSIAWCGIHVAHHVSVDTDDDPHDPARKGFWRVWFHRYEYQFRISKTDSRFLKTCLRDPRQVFIHRNYFKIYYAFVLLVIAVAAVLRSWDVLVGIWAWPVVFMFHGTGSANAICHRYGYQNYVGKAAGRSTNNLWLNLLLWGTALHNNHHGNPGAYSFATSKWYEIDLLGVAIKYLFVKNPKGVAA